MRRQPRPHRLALLAGLLVVSVALTTGCDAWGSPTWAAKVDGKEIPMSDVEALSTALSKQGGTQVGESNHGEGRLDGATTRDALGGLIQFELAAVALDQLGEQVPAAARQQAEQQLSLDIKGSARDRVIDGIAANLTLSQAMAQHLDSPVVAKLVDDFYTAQEQTQKGFWNGWTCLEGLTVSADARAEVDGRLDDGESLADIATAPPEGVSPVFGSETTSCLPISQLPQELQSQLSAAPQGDVVKYESQDQTGQTATYYLRVTGTKDIARDDPEVGQLLASALQSQQGQQLYTQFLSRIGKNTDIEVLPTIGQKYDLEQLIVVPPPFPLPPPTKGGSAGTQDQATLEP